METNTDERLERAIGILDELIALVRETGSESEMFLDMARLQLQLDLNGITDDEFGAFCDALEEGKFGTGARERVATTHARPRRNGELRLMRRAWRQPQDPLPQRGGAGAAR
jgi:hypothetical protein